MRGGLSPEIPGLATPPLLSNSSVSFFVVVVELTGWREEWGGGGETFYVCMFVY